MIFLPTNVNDLAFGSLNALLLEFTASFVVLPDHCGDNINQHGIYGSKDTAG
ncbi:hypothetical protein ESCOMMO228B1_05455 [Escherichia coli]|nr:hypothetical protein ECP029943811_2624 [Escherichia coli P0299438.11]ENC10412.1 hypothetical protein ECP02994385_2637 [Escherichia coli P0299438.5]ENC15574.1 hypothetical protein ECP02994386_2622 [Escherichia coli P0299438.6]ENC30705.1 hypothetical protein ECP02994388_5202 [Escherichia coli P0299438.8]SRY72894.1 Uncharacterised protein [Escherichia coli]